MKQQYRGVTHAWLQSIVVVLALAFGAIAITADAAEKKEQTCVKTNLRTAHKTVVTIGDVPNHEISQELSISDLKCPIPDFKNMEEWAYIHSDMTDGSGNQNGYFVDTHEDGSKTYGDFQGTIKTTVKDGGSWEANWEGSYKYLGGSGKYKNIKGNGTYKGRMSSTEPGKEESREVVEY